MSLRSAKRKCESDQSAPKNKKKNRLGDKGNSSPAGRGTPSSRATPPCEKKNTKNKKISKYSAEEIQTLENFKEEFCSTHDIDTRDFNATLESSNNYKGGLFAQDHPPITVQQLWESIYALLPGRDERSLRRFMRSHFYPKKNWRSEDDHQLKLLYDKLGSQWSTIARELDRSRDSVELRWKSKFAHESTKKMGVWDAKETAKLIQLLEETYKTHKQQGTANIGQDIYEMDEDLITWSDISNGIGKIRDSKQCSDKWRLVKKEVTKRREKGDLNATYDPAKKPLRARPAAKKLPTSKELVDSSSDEDKDASSSDSSDDSEDDSSSDSSDDDDSDES